MEIERELQRVLTTRELIVPATDPVGAVHAGMRRRRRTQRVQVLSAGLGIAGVAIGATLLVNNPQATTPAPPASAGPTSKPPSNLAAVPVGFTAQDLSFVTTQRGWALGTAPCGASSCTIQLVTTDGGSSWSRRPALGLPTTCSDAPCVRHIRFADARVGYAFGPSLFITNDGGSHWSAQSTSPVFGLEIAGGKVSRVVSKQDGCPGCSFLTQTSNVGSVVWRTAFSSDQPMTSAGLVRFGSRLAAPLFGNPAGGAGDAHTTVLLSKDGGSTWRSRQDPCSPPSSNALSESDATSLSFGPEGLLVALCTNRLADPGGTAVRLSTDSGSTFGPARPTPSLAVKVAAVSHDTVVVEAAAAGRDVLLLTADGGRSWKQVAAQPQPDGSLGAGFLAFSTPRTGTWVGADATTVWRTSDGGATWTAHPFR